ncbi:hypothetical protein AVEN_178802-1 [Araneus ventricosus]|uniref:Endonuclease/exonuclease/phosphatase domain-containing protein n=1 Tax=Araneus ventricosus TaxID=182803 RepID=A0A4Y2BEF3_ARAVE|nr:hypothetical protein AVEN_178802-1 [Araneus ventricosus]
MSETWMYEDKPIAVEVFELKAFINNTLKSLTEDRQHRASGVAISRNLKSIAACRPIEFTINDRTGLEMATAGDICMVDVTLNGQSRFILASVYIHPSVNSADLKLLLFSDLMKYLESSLLIDQEFDIDKEVPIIMMGDFNIYAKRNEKAFDFLKHHFNLNMVYTNYPSTLGNSCLDLTFTRNITPELLNYVCYF